jgi:serine protease Do
MKRFMKSLLGFVSAGAVVAGIAVMLESRSLGLDTHPAPKFNVDSAAITRDTHGQNSYAPIVKKAAPSVVTISTTHTVRMTGRSFNPFDDPMFRQFFGENPRQNRRPREFQEQGLGSGVIVSPDGYIITANHVIEGADSNSVKVALANGDKEFTAKVIGADPQTDVAVLKIDSEKLPAITIADSDKVEVGDVVLAIGNPFNVGQTVTRGIVSALGRTELGVYSESGGYENFIQTDAAINPGNSGGALVDAEGRLIGINTVIFSRSGGFQGVGFAVPSNLARSVMERIVKFGKVTRAYLGVTLHPGITADLAEAFNLPDREGAIIDYVEPNTPAAKAGLKNGDVIREVDGKKISDWTHLRLMISQMTPGTRVTLLILHSESGKKPVEKSVTVTLNEMPANVGQNDENNRRRPSESAPENQDSLDGVEVGDITPTVRRQYDLPRDLQGALVTSVDEDSNAAKAELRAGDIIVEINRQPVRNADEAVDLSNKASGRVIVLRIWREGRTTYLTVSNRKQK